MTEMSGDNPLADGLSQLVDEHGLWEVHQALAALWQAHDMVLDPPHVEHQASITSRYGTLVQTGLAKETAFGTPIASSAFLPVAGANATSTSYTFTLNQPDYQLPVVPPEWLAAPFIPQTPIQAVPVDEPPEPRVSDFPVTFNLPEIVASVLEDEDDDE